MQRIYEFVRVRSSRGFRRRLRCYGQIRARIANRTGLEVGGPSVYFSRRSLIPVYRDAGRVDNCNFSHRTVWEGSLQEGEHFVYDRAHPPGHQFIAEAGDLSGIPSERYDFLLASHVLEHVANAMGALQEWMRVVKREGTLVLLVPHREGTFDHRRPVTPLQHFFEDFEKSVGEDDATHVEEVLRLHDLSMDPLAGDAAAFRERSLKNVENRCLHHHVFDTRRMVELVDAVGLQILAVETFLPNSILVLARKPAEGEPVRNEGFREEAAWACRSPFASDREPARNQ